VSPIRFNDHGYDAICATAAAAATAATAAKIHDAFVSYIIYKILCFPAKIKSTCSVRKTTNDKGQTGKAGRRSV